MTTDVAPLEGPTYRIGVGAGFAGDRYEPATALAENAGLDALGFECLAERTIANAHHRARGDGEAGFDARILRRLRTTMPQVVGAGGVVTTNAGAADPHAAAVAVLALGHELGMDDLKVAAVGGDDVLDALILDECRVMGTDDTLERYRGRIISANAYTGAQGLVDAMRQGAQAVITGRTSDAALFLAPLAAHFGWDIRHDAEQVANGLLIGHLLECGGQLTGGYFADGGRKQVRDLAHLGFPYADVDSRGHAVFRKLPHAGGRLDTATVVEQLLYEIEDPSHYPLPDGTLDFSKVMIRETGPDEVEVHGARIVDVPAMLKVSVGIDDGLLATAGISYAGPGALERARLAIDILRERWVHVLGFDVDELTFDITGYNSTRPWYEPSGQVPPEVRVRAAVRTFDSDRATALGEEVEGMYTNGPSGGGGASFSMKSTVGLVSTLVPRDFVTTTVEVLS